MRITKNTQEKLTDILRIQGFTVRYEKGNFQGGHCVVMDQRMIVLNKFYPLESKINTLVEVISQVEINPELLTDDQQKLVKQAQKRSTS